jgi:regulator of sigma E protease
MGSASGVFALFSFLSVNFAILNLLPIPALDGGQIVMTIMEKVSPKWNRVRLPLSILGWLFLIFVMVYATTRDITRLLG